MENGQSEEVGRAQGCWRCYQWFPGRTPRANPEEEIQMVDMQEQAAQQAGDEQQGVAPVAAENPQGMNEPQQPINREEAANVENPRQPEEAKSAQEDCCCLCFFPQSTPQQEIAPPAQDAAPQVEDGQPEDVAAAAVNLQPMSGSQQPLNLTDEGIIEKEMEPVCPKCPRENQKSFLMFAFVLLFLLCTGQALNIMSYTFGWRDNGTKNAHTSTETNSNTTTESNMIFYITTAITM